MQPACSPSRLTLTWPSLPQVLLAAVFLATSATGQGAETTPKPTLESYLVRLGYESIPLEMTEGNHLMVRGVLQGKRRVFLLDTGWSKTTLDRSIARKLKTIGERGGSFEDSILGKLDNRSVLLLDLQLGQSTFTNQPAVSEKIQSDGQSISDGVLGADFLFRNHCLIDCPRKRLFVRGAAPPKEVRQALEVTLRLSGYQGIALDRDTDLALTVMAKANDHPIRLLVDTGAIYSVLDRSQTRRLSLRTIDTQTRIVGVGRIGSAALHAATLNSLELGEFTLRDVMFGVTDLSSWGIGGRAESVTDMQGILGADQLFLNGALIDYTGLTLWLRPAQPSKPTE
jgi:predicted aspartyl protease